MFMYFDNSMTAQATCIYSKILNKFELFPLEILSYFLKYMLFIMNTWINK